MAACVAFMQLWLALSLFAGDPSEQSTAAFALPPIQVPEGFTVELVAGPPLVKYPMMAAFDEHGRLFIAESDGQNLGKQELLEQKPRFVRMIEDTDSDGKFDKSTIFADRMVMPEGALCHNGSFYIMSAPYLWRLHDTDGDGIADRRAKLVGEMDLIGNANQHGPYLTPAGRLLFSGGTFGYNLVGSDGGQPIQGNWASVFSCNVDGGDVRVESHAGINPVEVEFTPEGEMIGTCAIFDRIGGRCDALVHWVHGGSYAERLREPNLKQTGRYLPAAIRWGQVAPSGLVRMRGSQFGDEYRDNLFACLFNTHELVRIRLERVGATFRGAHEVFLRSSSTDFHPADVLEDADGSLLLVDTGAWLTMGCPSSKNGQPGGFGGIYRIRKIDGPVLDDPRGRKLAWQTMSTGDLARRLDDPRPEVRDRAVTRLVDAGNGSVSVLANVLNAASQTRSRRNAVWALSRIGTRSAREALRTGLSDEDPSVRQATVHALGVLRDRSAVDRLMTIVVEDQLPVRREAATALGLIGDPRTVPALFESLRTASDEFLEHALIYALIEIGEAAVVSPGLADADPRVQRGALIALDQIDGESLRRDEVVPLLATTDAELQRVVLEVISRRPTWGDEMLGHLRDSVTANEPSSMHRAIITGTVSAFWENPDVQSLVAQSLDRQETPSETLLVLIEAIGRIPQAQLPEMWLAPLERRLIRGDDALRRQLLASLIPFDTRRLERALRALAKDDSLAIGVRVGALGLVAGNGSELDAAELRLLVEQMRAEAAPVERLAAANALSAAKLTAEQLLSLSSFVREAGPLELPSLLRAFESAVHLKRIDEHDARRIGLALVDSLAQSPGRESLPDTRVHAALANYPAEVVARAVERFPGDALADEEQRAKVNEIEAGVEQGDMASGKQLFFSNRLACSACHKIDGRGGAVGPDLSHIGKIRSARQLAEAVLLPSATLANGFESYTLLTGSGQVMTGLIRRETAEAIYLVSTDGKELRLPRAEIEDIRPSSVSIMPQGLDTQLTRKQLRDLVAYLTTLN